MKFASVKKKEWTRGKPIFLKRMNIDHCFFLHCGYTQWLLGNFSDLCMLNTHFIFFLIEEKPSKELERLLGKAGKTQDMVIKCDRSKNNSEGSEEEGRPILVN